MFRRPRLWLALASAAIALVSIYAWRSGPQSPTLRGAHEARGAPSGDDYRDEVAALLRAGRLDRAEAVLARWLAAVPADERARLAEGELLARQGRTSEAIETLTPLADTSGDPARVWLRLAELHEASGEQKRAIECCRLAVASRPDWLDPVVKLGDLLRIAGRLGEAAACLESVLERQPASPAARHALAAVRNAEGRFEDVVALIEPLLGDAELSPNAREHYAVALDGLGRRVEAADVWTSLLEADPFAVEGYYRLGRLCRRLQRPQLAAALLEEYEELAPYSDALESARKLELGGERLPGRLQRAAAYARTGQVGRAIEHYHRALRTPGADVDASLTAILYLLRLDLFHEADELVAWLRSTARLPDPVADAMVGLVAEREGRAAAAAEAYRRALERLPNYRPVLIALGRIRLEENLIGAASVLIERAHEAQADGESLVLLGRVALARGELSVAVRRFQDALDRAERRAARTEARTQLGRALVASRKPGEAVEHLEEAARQSPWAGAAWNVLALAHQQLGEAERAGETAERAAAAERLKAEAAEIRRSLRTAAAAERARGYVRLAMIEARRGNLSRQREYLWAALSIDAACTAAYRQLADAHTQPREVFFRLHALRRLLALLPQDASTQRRLATTYAEAGLDFARLGTVREDG